MTVHRRSPQGLRLTSGLLRAPTPSRFATRTSETATATRADAVGWIERALIEHAEDVAPEGRVAGLVADIRRARVGGTFWAPAPDWPSSVGFVVKFDHAARLDEALAFALEHAAPDEIGVLLPRRRWAAGRRGELQRRGVSVHVGEADPWAVLDQSRAVLVDGDDELGFLALLAGRTVHGWSRGYLTGWGLTQDHPSAPARGHRDLPQLAAAALVEGVRYYDPFNGRVTACEDTIAYLANWRRRVDEDRDLACLAGIARWKRSQLRRFVAASHAPVPFLDSAEACVSRARTLNGSIGVWPTRAPAHLDALAARAGVPLRQIEDGFVRSVGLGSDLLPPCSIVIDRCGIYYDPAQPSDLELILTNTDFSAAIQARAVALVTSLRANNMTKYNTGGERFIRPAARRVVLVPGQVEDDRSFVLGGAGCAGNLDLARRVREHEPDAFIIYRPHPDVEAGNRIGAVPDEALSPFVDSIDRTSAMSALLDGVDAVHVLTSLAGFEALLRGREVVTHGQPFYCGWGLTRDLAAPPRRGRVLNVAELVAGALILYPRYLDPITQLPCPPEVLVDRLAGLRSGPTMMTKVLRRLRQRFEAGRPRKPFAGSSPARRNFA